MLNKQLLLIIILICIFIIPGFTQNNTEYSAIQIGAAPYAAFPLGTDVDYFGMSIGGHLGVDFAMPFVPAISIGPALGYSLNLLAGDHGDMLSTISGGAVLKFAPFLSSTIQINILGGGGYYYSLLNDEPDQAGSNPYVNGGLGLSIYFGDAKSFSIGLGGEYRNYLGFFQEIGVSLSGNLQLGKKYATADEVYQPLPAGPVVTPLKLQGFSADAIFPTLLKYYNDHPFGTVEVYNPNPFPVEDVKISFFMNNYMDNKKDCGVIDSIEPEGTAVADLYGLFNNSILDIYEKTTVSASLVVDFTAENQQHQGELPVSVEILDRNALVWDDDRRAAAFVTAKDPVVMKFAKNVMSEAEIEAPLIKNLYRGIALFTALKQHGMTYNIDPGSSYAELSGAEQAIDYMQYPRQSLDYKSGDCDDLTVLNAALFESLGIPAAFVTIPGHIFMAFSLNMSYRDAASLLVNPEDLIDYNGEAWVPVEITMVKDGFLEAWNKGAREWQSAEENGETGFFPVQEAWKTFESVAFFENTTISFDGGEEFKHSFDNQIDAFVGIQLAPQVASLKARAESSSSPYKIKNKAGILYARYGQYEDAEQEFDESLEMAPEYKPTLLNMGNLMYILKDYTGAYDYFSKAAEIDDDDAKSYISLALACRELGRHADTLKNYNRAYELKPELAEKYAYLAPGAESSARASDAAPGSVNLLWDE